MFHYIIQRLIDTNISNECKRKKSWSPIKLIETTNQNTIFMFPSFCRLLTKVFAGNMFSQIPELLLSVKHGKIFSLWTNWFSDLSITIIFCPLSTTIFIKYYANQDNYDCNKCQHSQSDDYTARFSGLCSEGCCRTFSFQDISAGVFNINIIRSVAVWRASGLRTKRGIQFLITDVKNRTSILLHPYWLTANPSNSPILVFQTMKVVRIETSFPRHRCPILVWTTLFF